MNEAAFVKQYVQDLYSSFGINKKHEISRLLYEISRREHISITEILDERLRSSSDFRQVKSALVRRRYPDLRRQDLARLAPLTMMTEDVEDQVFLSGPGVPDPDEIFYERSLRDSDLVCHLKEALPAARFDEIDSYSDYVKGAPFTISTYNNRRCQFFVVRENYDLFLPCPCSKGAQPCGYDILNAGFGCGYDCVYCYLQGYTNSPGIVIPGNLQEILKRFMDYYRPGMRLGTGQFTDSLLYDHLTEFSPQIIDFFRGYPDVTFEFKTKSDRVDRIVSTPAPDNIVVSWTVNPPWIVDEIELLTAPLENRIGAAQRCVDAGYRVGFHFDPLLDYQGWEEDYRRVVDRIFKVIPENRICWISLGCLRMTVRLRQVMERRFPETRLLDAQQIIGFDGKLRYPRWRREQIYRSMIEFLRSCAPRIPLYLCMEDRAMNQAFGIQPLGK